MREHLKKRGREVWWCTQISEMIHKTTDVLNVSLKAEELLKWNTLCVCEEDWLCSTWQPDSGSCLRAVCMSFPYLHVLPLRALLSSHSFGQPDTHAHDCVACAGFPPQSSWVMSHKSITNYAFIKRNSIYFSQTGITTMFDVSPDRLTIIISITGYS